MPLVFLLRLLEGRLRAICQPIRESCRQCVTGIGVRRTRRPQGSETMEPEESIFLVERLSERQLQLLYRRILRNYEDRCSFPALLSCLPRLELSGDVDTLRLVFESCDLSKKGHLTFAEFNITYDILFARSRVPLESILQRSVVYVRAIRYGYSKVDNKYIYEAISGTSYELKERVVYATDLKSLGLGGGGVEVSKMSGNFDTLIGLILTDQATNTSNGSELKWWIRLSSDSVFNESTARCALALGLPHLHPPQDSDLSRYLAPSSHRQYVIHPGFRRPLLVHSSTVPLRTSYLAQLPVIEVVTSPKWSLRRYFISRFSVFRSHANLPCSEHINALHRADSLTNVS